MAETLGTRVTRLEEAMIRLANAQAHLAEVQAADETGARERQAANEAEIRALKMEALEREKRIDDRIEKLVVAIGELIGRMDGRQK